MPSSLRGVRLLLSVLVSLSWFLGGRSTATLMPQPAAALMTVRIGNAPPDSDPVMGGPKPPVGGGGACIGPSGGPKELKGGGDTSPPGPPDLGGSGDTTPPGGTPSAGPGPSSPGTGGYRGPVTGGRRLPSTGGGPGGPVGGGDTVPPNLGPRGGITGPSSRRSGSADADPANSINLTQARQVSSVPGFTDPENYAEIGLSDLEELCGTPNHPVFDFRSGLWRGLGHFRVGDLLQGNSGSVEVVARRVCSGEFPVFNLVVADAHIFRVGVAGVLVHNGGGKCRKNNRKGERSEARRADGTKNPYKHLRPHPTDPDKVIFKDPHTGKDIVKPRPPDFPGN